MRHKLANTSPSITITNTSPNQPFSCKIFRTMRLRVRFSGPEILRRPEIWRFVISDQTPQKQNLFNCFNSEFDSENMGVRMLVTSNHLVWYTIYAIRYMLYAPPYATSSRNQILTKNGGRNSRPRHNFHCYIIRTVTLHTVPFVHLW